MCANILIRVCRKNTTVPSFFHKYTCIFIKQLGELNIDSENFWLQNFWLDLVLIWSDPIVLTTYHPMKII